MKEENIKYINNVFLKYINFYRQRKVKYNVLKFLCYS